MKTLGEILLEGRLRKGYSLNDCMEFTNIHKKDIKRMENDEWNRLLTRERAIKLITVYCDLLCINGEDAVQIFNEDYPADQLVFEEDPEDKRIREEKERLIKEKRDKKYRFMFIALCALAFIGIFVYSTYFA